VLGLYRDRRQVPLHPKAPLVLFGWWQGLLLWWRLSCRRSLYWPLARELTVLAGWALSLSGTIIGHLCWKGDAASLFYPVCACDTNCIGKALILQLLLLFSFTGLRRAEQSKGVDVEADSRGDFLFGGATEIRPSLGCFGVSRLVGCYFCLRLASWITTTFPKRECLQTASSWAVQK
jgi:hypothetical protein